MPSSTRDTVLLLSVGVLWGAAFPVILLGLNAGAPPFAFVTVRFALAAGLMALIAALRREALPDGRSLLLSAAIGGPFVMGGYAVLLFWGESSTSAGFAAILVGTSPILTAALSWAILPQERWNRLGLAGLALGFVGLIVLFLPSSLDAFATTIWGPIAVVAATSLFATGSVLLRRFRTGGETPWGASVQFGAGALFALPFSWAFEHGPSIPLTLAVLLPLLYLVVAASVAGFLLYFTLHGRVGPSRANLVSYISPVTAVIAGILLLGEGVTVLELVGFALVAGGMVLLRWRPRPHEAPIASPKGQV